jgi:ABC-type Zn2+ transport system substrate-binding protein/surface adhesin
MDSEKLRTQSELVRSLASTIHKKMMAPSADRADIVNREIRQINQRLAVLENELTRLYGACRTTRFLAFSLTGCAVLLSLVLFYLVS